MVFLHLKDFNTNFLIPTNFWFINGMVDTYWDLLITGNMSLGKKFMPTN